MKVSSVLASAFLAAVLVFGGLWALNNTVPGLNVKCRIFNDLAACLVLALTEPFAPSSGDQDDNFVPPPPESPEERIAREAAEEQARRDAEVRDAATALGWAIDDLSGNAAELGAGAADMASAVDNLAGSIDEGMQSAYEALNEQTQVRPAAAVGPRTASIYRGRAEGNVEVSAPTAAAGTTFRAGSRASPRDSS